LNRFKSRKYPLLNAIGYALLLLITICENLSDLFINSNEFLCVCWELFLYLIGMNEKILKERPLPLDFTYNDNNLSNISKSFVPVCDSVLKGSEIS